MISGSVVALITPFTTSGAVDYSVLENLIHWQIEQGTEGLVLCGSTGEGFSLSFEEKCAIFKAGAKIGKGKIQLIANTGTNRTEESVALTREAKKCGMDAVLVIVPYYNLPTPEGCYEHFTSIAKMEIPIIVYNHPGRTGLSLSAKVLTKICQLKHVIGIKEASGDCSLVAELLQEEIGIFSGNDDLALPMLAFGAIGTISIIGNVIPNSWKQFVHLALTNQMTEARAQFREIYPLVKALVLETNPQCVKYAVSLMGKCLPQFRLPLVQPKQENQKIIHQVLDRYRVMGKFEIPVLV